MYGIDQICYGLIFVRDLTDPAVADHMAAAIVDGRSYSASTAELVAAVDAALAEQHVPAVAVGIAEHSEPDILAFLALLRPALQRHAR